MQTQLRARSPRIADVFHARQVIRPFLAPTPLLRSQLLSEMTGAEVYIKYENMTPIRSFKARGALYCVARLDPATGGVSCASTGNHGQGLAYAGQCFGRRVVVVVPEGANEQKMRAIQSFGARLVVAGRTLAEANEVARQIAADEQLRYVEDGEDLDVMIGCGTLALDIVEQLPEIDAMVIPVGGGNLAGACCFVMRSLKPTTTMIGVQAAGAPAVFESWHQGRLLTLDQCATFAGGLATNYPGSTTFPYLQAGLDDMWLATDDEIRAAARLMLQTTGHLPEGAGATALAGLLKQPTRFAGQRVVILLTGGNFESTLWDATTSGHAAVDSGLASPMEGDGPHDDRGGTRSL